MDVLRPLAILAMLAIAYCKKKGDINGCQVKDYNIKWQHRPTSAFLSISS